MDLTVIAIIDQDEDKLQRLSKHLEQILIASLVCIRLANYLGLTLKEKFRWHSTFYLFDECFLYSVCSNLPLQTD